MTTLPRAIRAARRALAVACACGDAAWSMGVSREIGGALVRAEIRSRR